MIDSAKADMTIFDSSDIEAFLTENNPKYANQIIQQLKAFAKVNNFDNNYDSYKVTYNKMPLMQLQIQRSNFKLGVVINGLGIIRHISFYNKEFLDSHPEIVIKKESDSPDEDKCVHDS